MATKDIDLATSRFLSAAARIRNGLDMQRARITRAAEDAPRLLEGQEGEVTNLTDTFENDLDYYIYEMGRLRDMAEEMAKPFSHPPEIKEALAAFDEAVPELKKHRNARTHPSDDDRLDDVVSLSAAVRLRPVYPGGVTYLVDPRYQHHDAALALLDVIQTYLRGLLQAAAKSRPAEGLSAQIARRNSETATTRIDE